MAITIDQTAFATNTLAQTFNVVYGATPTEGDLLVAFLWHDETSADIADLTSGGWIRMGTFLAAGLTPDFRISVWAKFAGASEPTTVAFDIGEVNRRVHGWAIEISGFLFDTLQAEDTADQVDNEETIAGISNQVDAALTIPAGVIAVAMIGMTGTITDPSVSWDSGVTTIADASANFRGSGIGYLEGSDTQQPTASWTGSRTNAHLFIIVGVPPPSSKLLTGSSFQIRPAS